MSPQRRQHVRAEAVVPVRVWRDEDTDPLAPIDTYAIDISGGGFRIAGPAILNPGDAFNFSMTLPGRTERMEGSARVVREGGDGGRGCEFEALPFAHRELIVKFVFVQQRVELSQRHQDRVQEDPYEQHG